MASQWLVSVFLVQEGPEAASSQSATSRGMYMRLEWHKIHAATQSWLDQAWPWRAPLVVNLTQH